MYYGFASAFLISFALIWLFDLDRNCSEEAADELSADDRSVPKQPTSRLINVDGGGTEMSDMVEESQHVM